MCYYRRIRNISKGAVVGAGPYKQVFRQSESRCESSGFVAVYRTAMNRSRLTRLVRP